MKRAIQHEEVRRFPAAFETGAVLEAICGEPTITGLVAKHQLCLLKIGREKCYLR